MTAAARSVLQRMSGHSCLGRGGLVVGGMLLLIAAAHADDANPGASIATRGVGTAPACASCHGATGQGQAAAGFPRLAGQGRAYLVKQLRDFARGQRNNPVMKPIAASLSEAQIEQVAVYYASLPAWHPSALEAATRPPAAGKQAASAADKSGYALAARGDWNNGLPACFACHGQMGRGIAPNFPSLAGQPAAYTRAQMDAWQRGQRQNDPQGLMQAVARKMSEADIAAVSMYFENPTVPGAAR